MLNGKMRSGIERNAAEHALVQRVLHGERDAFREIIAQYQKLVYHIVYRLVSDETDREELCQEIFIRVYENLAAFKFQAKLSTWIGRIAYNACINFFKKKRLPIAAPLDREGTAGAETTTGHGMRIDDIGCTPEHLPDAAAEKAELYACLEREIARLPVPYRALITLFHLEEMSLKEIAGVMSLPEGTIKSYLFRARKLLKSRLLTTFAAEDIQ